MSSRVYIIVNRAKLNNRFSAKVHRFNISCLGGEKDMPKEPKMVFVSNEDIPEKAMRGKSGTRWSDLLAKIPKGESWHLVEGNPDFKLATVIAGVKRFNKTSKDRKYDIATRKEGDKQHVYIHLAEDAEE